MGWNANVRCFLNAISINILEFREGEPQKFLKIGAEPDSYLPEGKENNSKRRNVH